jgi:hypothetical protein
MTGKVKTFAVALLAIAAIASVTASAASAAEIHIKDMGKATGDATQLQGVEFKIPEGGLACPQAKGNIYTAYKLNAKGEQEDVETTGTTFRARIEEKETPLEPETIHCKFAGVSGTVVHMNGCDFDLHLNTLQGTLTCPKEKQITVTVIIFGVLKCTIHIPEQSAIGPINIQNNETKQDIQLTGEGTGVKYSTTKGSGLGACTETQAGTDAIIRGTGTVQGTANGVASDIWYE